MPLFDANHSFSLEKGQKVTHDRNLTFVIYDDLSIHYRQGEVKVQVSVGSCRRDCRRPQAEPHPHRPPDRADSASRAREAAQGAGLGKILMKCI